ncbi:PAS and ANTAR domain-containing protein [Nocardia carnea]|uniref:PAS and ANTAR domain-containing protein n=1 Tax=Nocardia carnea TaxID=37328 RepID=UPI003D783D28
MAAVEETEQTTEQRWEWSDEVAALHGYSPGEVQPTTELLLSQKHPDDRAEVADTLAMVTQTGQPFSSRHRVIHTAGRTRHVLVVGEPDARRHRRRGRHHRVLHRRHRRSRRGTPANLDQLLPEKIAAREAIEQAKGALMMVYGITADQAFQVLVWCSQETNTKLRELATTLVSAVPGFGGADVRLRTRFDQEW